MDDQGEGLRDLFQRLRTDLCSRRDAIPGEIQEREERGRQASQELLQAFPEAVEALRRVNRHLYSLARRKGELELLEDVLEALEDTGDSGRLPTGMDSVLEAQEEERRRTSIRIHDGPAQTLANIMMRLEFCEKLASKDGAKASREIEDVRQELGAVLQEIRHLIFDLRPMTLDDLGLLPTLQRFVEYEKERVPFSVQLLVRGPFRRFPPEVETHLYRIIQEGLWNAARHADPSEVHIRFRIEPEEVRVGIEDDGRGFAPAEDPVGNGMAEIRRRVRALGGRADWTSEPGAGCRLEIVVPIQGDEP